MAVAGPGDGPAVSAAVGAAGAVGVSGASVGDRRSGSVDGIAAGGAGLDRARA